MASSGGEPVEQAQELLACLGLFVSYLKVCSVVGMFLLTILEDSISSYGA